MRDDLLVRESATGTQTGGRTTASSYHVFQDAASIGPGARRTLNGVYGMKRYGPVLLLFFLSPVLEMDPARMDDTTGMTWVSVALSF